MSKKMIPEASLRAMFVSLVKQVGVGMTHAAWEAMPTEKRDAIIAQASAESGVNVASARLINYGALGNAGINAAKPTRMAAGAIAYGVGYITYETFFSTVKEFVKNVKAL